MPAISLSAHGIRIQYAHRLILSVDELFIAGGSSVVLQGPSGSGKTSLLRMFAGENWDHSGIVEYQNTIFGTLTTEDKKFLELQKTLIGMTLAEPIFFEYLSARENIFFPHIFGNRPYDPIWHEELITFFRCEWILSEKISALSSGERERIDLIRTLLYEPRVLFLDEPGAHLDDLFAREVVEFLQKYQEKNSATLVIVSHSDMFSSLADARYRCESGILKPIL